MAVRYSADGTVRDILIVESKFAAKGVARLSSTVNKGTQMGPRWIDKTLQEMRDRGGELKKTADFVLENQDKVRFKGHVLNAQGTNRS